MTILQIKYIIVLLITQDNEARTHNFKNVEISQLFDRIKEHLQEIKLDIIHEERKRLLEFKGAQG